jgi:hypothetical protein
VRAPQSAFTMGEVSPLLHGRVEMAQYGTACRTLRNMILAPQGPALNRPGFEFMCEVKDSSKAVRLVPFSFGGSVHYMLEFGDQYIRFHTTAGKVVLATSDTDAWASGENYAVDGYVDNDGLVYRCILAHESAAGNEPGTGASWETYWVQDASLEVTSPYLEADLFALKFAQSASMLWIVHPDYQPRTLSRLSALSWSLDKYYVKGGPFQAINQTDTTITVSEHSGGGVVPGATVELEASADLFDAGHVGSLFGFRVMYGQASYSATCAETGTWTSDSYPVFGPWMVVMTPDKTKKVDEQPIYIERSTDNGNTWVRIYTFPANDSYAPVITIGSEWDEPVLLRFVRSVAAVTGDLATLSLESQGALRWAAVRITAVTDSKNALGLLLDPFDKEDTALTAWAAPAWSDYDGWPIAVGFYEDRLVLAGSPLNVDTWWMSQPGDYNNFGQHIPVIESDMTSFTMLSREVNAIRSLVEIGDILAMLTSGGEWAVSGGQAPISPANVMAHMHGHAGSNEVDPVGVGTVALHAQDLGGALRELFYDEASQGYDGNNLSVLANHLTDGQVIKQMAYQQTPYSVAWIVLESGALLGLTYMRNQQVIAWHRHDTGEADLFESAACMKGATENELWVVVKRNIGGAWKRYIERLHTRADALADAFFVDSGVTYSGAATTTITGLGHLEGMAVAVNADGVKITGKTISSGQITLATAAAKVHVGLPIEADFESLGAEFNAGDGTSMGKRRRVGRATPRVYRTYGGQIGKDADHLHAIKYLGASLFTGSLEPQVLEADWTREGRIFIRQADPFPMTIIAVVPEIEAGG